GVPAQAQLRLAGHPQVAYPLRLPARGDQVALAAELEQVDDVATRLPAAPPAYRQDAAAHQTHAVRGEPDGAAVHGPLQATALCCCRHRFPPPLESSALG